MTRRCVPRPPRPAAIRYVDYGSELRDSAAVLAFAAANPGNQTRLTALIDRIAERFSRAAPHQHAGAGLAADGCRSGGQGGRRAMTVATGDGAPETRTDPLYLRRPLGSGGAPMAIANRGDTPGLARRVDHRGAERRSAGREPAATR